VYNAPVLKPLHRSMITMPFRSICFFTAVILLTACTINPTGQQGTREPLATATVTATPTDSPTLTAPENTPENILTLSVWLPELLAPGNNQAATLVLTQQIDNFRATQPDVLVQTRLKRAEGKGGVIATMLSASEVAPASLPDLTLIRRQDLRLAVQAGLAQPLDGRLAAAVTSDLYTAALRLGQVNGKLFALPYTLEVLHIAYRRPTTNFAYFENVIDAGRRLVMPLGQVNGMSDVFLVQYLAAGGSMVNGNLGPLNVDALQTVLEFYEQTVAAGVIDTSVLNYPTPEDYQAGLLDERIQAAVVTSKMYLDLLADGQELETSPLPVDSGLPTTSIDGWMWLLTAKSPDRQQAALRFLQWMFDSERQAAYTRAIAMLPSTQSAMSSWGNASYTDFVDSILVNAVLPLDDNEGNSSARILQNALIAVISGETTAEEIVQDVADQIGD
jgi:ABC-type glycerol-3-phosphate transport system substrate-binding protein